LRYRVRMRYRYPVFIVANAPAVLGGSVSSDIPLEGLWGPYRGGAMQFFAGLPPTVKNYLYNYFPQIYFSGTGRARFGCRHQVRIPPEPASGNYSGATEPATARGGTIIKIISCPADSTIMPNYL